MQWTKIDEVSAYMNVAGGTLYRYGPYRGAALCFVPWVQGPPLSYSPNYISSSVGAVAPR